MKDKKGFTLIELLAVVVILLAISVMAISSISAAIERNKTKQNESKYEIIISYAKLYYDEHKNTLSKKEKKCIAISDLDLDETEKTDADGNEITGFVIYSIDATGNNITFEYSESCS